MTINNPQKTLNFPVSSISSVPKGEGQPMTIKNLRKTHSSPVSSILRSYKKGLKVTRTVPPGKPGAVRELKRFGARLLCVRYLKDGRGRFVKTVELIVYERHEYRQIINKGTGSGLEAGDG